MRRLMLAAVVLIAPLAACSRQGASDALAAPASAAQLTPASHPGSVATGQSIFRFDTFGDETFWTDTLHMHEVIAKSVSPKTALSVGLKVDATALPEAVVKGIQGGTVDLNAPATTVTLLKLDAVVGVIGKVSADGKLERVGITCALCHSTVDNSFAAGIGKRLDGWPNRDLNVGAIVALSPAVTPAQKEVYGSWGPGKYDPRFNIDGKNMPVVIPPAFGLRTSRRRSTPATARSRTGTRTSRSRRCTATASSPIRASASRERHAGSRDAEAARAARVSVQPRRAGRRRGHIRQRRRASRSHSVHGAARCASCHVSGNLTDVNRRPARAGGRRPGRRVRRYAARRRSTARRRCAACGTGRSSRARTSTTAAQRRSRPRSITR